MWRLAVSTSASVTKGSSATIDPHGTDTAHIARELGVPDERSTTIAAQVDGIMPANGADAAHALMRIGCVDRPRLHDGSGEPGPRQLTSEHKPQLRQAHAATGHRG